MYSAIQQAPALRGRHADSVGAFSVRGGLLAVAIVAMIAGASFGQSKTETAPRQAEVTGTDVYIRSGPSSNHYPVVKLGAGERITVVGENREWFEILPPEGAFSFISGDFVDTGDNKTGVVNGNNVRVRAGSVLPEFAKNKYVVQTKLSRGAEVSILGRDPDGYLRIKPPEGVTVWVHNGYVALLANTNDATTPPATASTRPNPDEAAGNASPPEAAKSSEGLAGAASPTGTPASPKPSDEWTFQGLPETPQRRTLAEIDDLIGVEMEKPVIEREFSTMVARYEVVAGQTDDDFASRYAKARLRQFAQMSSVIAVLRGSRIRNEELEALRRGFVDERARIREDLPPIPSGLDARGVLRTSALYPAGAFPQRYRLTDPTSKRDRTLAYVEVRPNAEIDVASFLDRYVGVRATGTRLQTGGIQPVPIYVVSEIVLLEDESVTNDSSDEG